MSKIALSVGSFFLGIFIAALFFSGIQISTVAHPAFASDLISFGGAPTVPPLNLRPATHMTFENLSGAPVALDGLNCEDCTFKNVVFGYSGGEYRLQHCTVSGPRVIVFSGAALNTVRAMIQWGLIQSTPVEAPLPKAPNIKIENTTPLTNAEVSWISFRQ